jgi:hypothetical protein
VICERKFEGVIIRVDVTQPLGSLSASRFGKECQVYNSFLLLKEEGVGSLFLNVALPIQILTDSVRKISTSDISALYNYY